MSPATLNLGVPRVGYVNQLRRLLLNRFNATMFAQTPPPGTPPYSPHPVEWLTTVGILAGAALAWYVAVRWLVIFEEKQHI